MELNRTIKLFLTVSIIIFLIFGFLHPGSFIAIEVNENDGIWTDSFENSSSTDRGPGTSPCVWENGMILLTTASDIGRNYSFADGGSFKNNNHKAYYYQFFDINHILFSFFSPLIPSARVENEFDNDFQYPYIEKKGESTHRYAESSTQGMNNNVVHHFRMKLQGTAEDIGNLYIYWYGKAENAIKVEMFYLNYGTIRSMWKPINSTQNTGDISFAYNLSQDKLEQAIGTDNYIDICVVATKKSFGNPQCTLYTDYVKLKSIRQKGYKIGYGLVQTKNTIDLRSNTYWELLTWDDFETGGAIVRYQILYNNGTSYVPIKNSILKGNEEGFTTSPVSLISLSDKYTNIKIRANLTTDDPSVSPKIFSWTITWQSLNRWHDQFSSEYRIDVKNKINVENGVNISRMSGDWPMFGQNPGNTRASTGKAAYTKDLYWWSDFRDYPAIRNQACGNPVVDSNALYIPVINLTTNKGSLYKYKSFVIDSNKIGEEYSSSQIIPFSNMTNGKKIIGSPAVSDSYVIVATGDEYTLNYVYAFDKNTPSKSPIWTFDYSKYASSATDICYWGSPIIAEGKVFLTSWSGQPILSGYHLNNMILALDLSNGELKWNYTFPPSSYPLLSPTWSFSTPAYSEGKIVVGCMNNLSDNLFAFESENGSLLWNISIGAIGKASPVIYNNTVYIVNEEKVITGIGKKTKVTAVNIDDGSIRWEKELGRTLTTISNLDFPRCLAQSTSAIANEVLYATSPDGNVTALDLSKKGTILWSHEVYSKGLLLSAPFLASSPAYADGIVYVSTPDGFLYALNTSAKGSETWHRQAFPYDQTIPIVTDPIVTNGLIFFGAENGRLYVCGNYKTPNEQITGSLTSIPIQLPEGVWWKKFYATVQTNVSTSINKITFSLLDANNNFIKVLQNKSDLSGDQTLGRTLRLHADFWAKNNSFNPKLLSWNITFFNVTKDTIIPFINMSTFSPNPKGWLNTVIPQFTVKVKDNDSGLLVNSAKYILGYTANNLSYSKTFSTQCSGVNGTTSVQQITINISKLDIYENITKLLSLSISITDMAGNTATKSITFTQDIIKPSSYVNKQSMKLRYNATAKFILINATSIDNGTNASGIKRVELYYRNSSTANFNGKWIYFANSTKKSPQWKFNFTSSSQPGGYFELCTRAIDNASNIEDFPTKGDVSFLYDWTKPYLPSFQGNILWFRELSTFSVVFRDDFRLDTIQYHPNFDTSWTTIATGINKSTYDKSWSLKDEYWNQINEGEFYTLFFKINDTLGNTLLLTNNSQAITFGKDTSAPNGTIKIPALENETSLSYNFTVVGEDVIDQGGSGIKEVSLYYRFSEDNSNWSSWTQYGDTLSSSPYEWEYTAQEKDGYYDFKINIVDVAGNTRETEILHTSIFPEHPISLPVLPVTLILIMISLLIVFSLLSAIIFIKWRKTKVT
ncbi:Outer membrane protein assembly factor BamB [uncultured archaeon]|nr:Outer membrane protein assembly factor BamB [uncultured archaeon]